MIFFIPLGPGYWLRSLIAVDAKGRTRKLRDGREDVWQVRAPADLKAYRRTLERPSTQ